MPFGKTSPELGDLRLALLHLILAKTGRSGGRRRADRFGRMSLADRDQLNVISLAAHMVGRGSDAPPDLSNISLDRHTFNITDAGTNHRERPRDAKILPALLPVHCPNAANPVFSILCHHTCGRG